MALFFSLSVQIKYSFRVLSVGFSYPIFNFLLILIPKTRYVCISPDCEKWPFFLVFMYADDVQVWIQDHTPQAITVVDFHWLVHKIKFCSFIFIGLEEKKWSVLMLKNINVHLLVTKTQFWQSCQLCPFVMGVQYNMSVCVKLGKIIISPKYKGSCNSVLM